IHNPPGHFVPCVCVCVCARFRAWSEILVAGAPSSARLPPPTNSVQRPSAPHTRTNGSCECVCSCPVVRKVHHQQNGIKKGFSTVWKKHWSQHHLPPFSPLQFWQPTHTGWCRAKKEKKPRRKSGYRKAPIGPLVLPCAYVCVCVCVCVFVCP
ncbi:AGAP012094-PB, partial [Anopheles gambiae str. PEST]